MLLAITASGKCAAIGVSTSPLSARSSGTDSTTRSQRSIASSASADRERARRPRRSSASARRPSRSTVASASSARARVASGWRAKHCTRWPPSAYSAAICEPIRPAPTTTTSISGDHRAMRIVITGGLGMLGTELARRLRATRPAGRAAAARHAGGARPARRPRRRRSCCAATSATRRCSREALDSPEVAVVHLASVVSGGAERDFDAALEVNLDGGRALVAGLPRARRRAAARVHELARRVRRRARARAGRRRHAADAARPPTARPRRCSSCCSPTRRARASSTRARRGRRP